MMNFTINLRMEDSMMMIVTNSCLLLFQCRVFLLCLRSFILHQHDIIINMAILFQIAYYSTCCLLCPTNFVNQFCDVND